MFMGSRLNRIGSLEGIYRGGLEIVHVVGEWSQTSPWCIIIKGEAHPQFILSKELGGLSLKVRSLRCVLGDRKVRRTR